MPDYNSILSFAQAHAEDDPVRLLLQQKRYPDVDMRLVVQQLEGRKQALSKWPSLAFNPYILYPPKINREQSSSEQAAQYKAQQIIQPGITVADLTGGMGIDSLTFAQAQAEVDYIELDPDLCQLMQHNSQVLQLHIHIHCADSIAWLRDNERHFDILYIDPARRDSKGRKVAAFEDCTPNLLDNLSFLTSRCNKLVVKASPMIDITTALTQLQQVSDVHILSIHNECKEVLFVCLPTVSEPTIHCVDIGLQHTTQHHFTPSQEAQAPVCYCSQVGSYLYEPHAALMKGGAYRSLCTWFPVEKLARNTHLYTSQQLIADFPGRIFHVLQEVQLNRKHIAPLLPEGRAHVVSRNHPVEASALQQQLKLKEGGTRFIIATTVGTTLRAFLCDRI